MGNQRNFILILIIIAVVATSIELTRTDFIIKLNKSNNIELIDYGKDETNSEEVDEFEYLIIYNSEDLETTSTVLNIENTLKVLKLSWKTIPLNDVKKIDNGIDRIIFVSETLNSPDFSEILTSYVFNGGKVFFAYRLGHDNGLKYISKRLGIEEYGGFIDLTGVKLKKNILVNGKGLKIEEKELTYNSSVALRLDETTSLIMESLNGTPLLWETDYGEGKIVYFNGTMLYSKINRGIISGALSYLDEYFIYPIINSKVLYIDDFPAPFPLGYDEKIKEDFNRSIPIFFKEVWWPDMLKLSSKYNLKYTGVVIGTYKNEVKNIAEEDIDLQVKDFIYYGKELIRNGGEMGIHGFNHQPFNLSPFHDSSLPYKPWENIETIRNSINTIKNFSKNFFPGYEFRVYVPPSNILYPEGRELLGKPESEIGIIASLYYISDYIDAYEQEFEIAEDGIVEAPRFTSGFNLEDGDLWIAINGISTHGVYSHFVHPDDLLDKDRSLGLGWAELYKKFDDFNDYFYGKYKWLNSHTATEGANAIISYSVLKPKYKKVENYLRIDSNTELNYYYLRTDKTVELVKGCKATKIDDRTYLIETENKPAEIYFER